MRILQDVEVRLGERDLLPERRRLRAQLRQRRAQVGDQVAQHPSRLRRIGLGQVLHRRQRVEQEMRLDLRLHQLQLRLDRLLRQQVPLGFRLVQRGRRARLAELDAEEQADEQAVDERGERRSRPNVVGPLACT